MYRLRISRLYKMKDLNALTIENFQVCLNQFFVVAVTEGHSLELELIQVKQQGVLNPEVGTRQPFSVLFRGPLEPMLPQQLYRVDNVEFGSHDLFLVPIGPDERGMLYDATFN